jgi:hypothetical protein
MANMSPSERLNKAIGAFEAFAAHGQASAPSGSSWERERKAARSTSGGGGRARASVIDEVVHDATVLFVQMIGLSSGVAVLFEHTERERIYNQVAVSTVVRSLLETAGVIVWLLEENLGPEERVRRWFLWQFDDLSSERNTLRRFGDPDDQSITLDHARLGEREDRLAARATNARFEHRRSDESNNQHAALLRPNGKAMKLPSSTELVDALCNFNGFYSFLSRTAHGSRSGVIEGLVPEEGEPVRGLHNALVSPSGLSPGLALRCTALALGETVSAVDEWCGSAAAMHPYAQNYKRVSRELGNMIELAFPLQAEAS